MSNSIDHRQLANQLDLFHFQDDAPGMVFWHPRGWALYRALEQAARRLLAHDGYAEVRTPQVLRQRIWEASGHWDNFHEDMFALEEEDRRAALKPVSCPGHIQLFQRAAPSYRDLPVRLAELGLCHRNEPSGTLQGLFRLRQFTQDDGHVFCSEEQVIEEIGRFCRSMHAFYAAFGLEEVSVALSTRPAKRAGSDLVWDRAEEWLAAAARQAGLDYALQPGAGAFYGPKLEFALRDREGRSWQCGTIQLDFVLPERFDIHYVDSSGARRRPAMLHRAVYGSLERFLGVLLEHHAGRLPGWLAPEQIAVVPIGEAHLGYAQRVAEELVSAGLRVRVEGRDENLKRRIARAHELAVPFILVVGGRECSADEVNLRDSSGQRSMPRAEALELLAGACAPPV